MWFSVRASVRAALRRTLYPWVQTVWGGGFALAGRLSRARGGAEAWIAAGGAPVLIVATHPDDEASGCGGVVCLHRDAGDPVAVLVVTDGRVSRAGGLEPLVMAARRADEARAAAKMLGVARLELAGLHEGAWMLEEGVEAIRRNLRVWRPAVVYAPSCVDYHPEHLRVACACAAAVAEPGNGGPVVRAYETFVPLGPGLVNRVADISAVEERKTAALACYTSQQRGLAQVRRRDGYLARFYGVGRAAEAFRELSSDAFAALVEAGNFPDHRPPFRGLRGRPLTDPLAYLVGRTARHRLQRLPKS